MKFLCELNDDPRYDHVWMDTEATYSGLDDYTKVDGDMYPFVGYVFKLDGVLYKIENDTMDSVYGDDRFSKMYACVEIESIDAFTTDEIKL